MKRFDRVKIRCGETVLMVKTFQCVSTIREKDRIPRSASVVRFWLLFLNNSLHCQRCRSDRGREHCLGER